MIHDCVHHYDVFGVLFIVLMSHRSESFAAAVNCPVSAIRTEGCVGTC